MQGYNALLSVSQSVWSCKASLKKSVGLVWQAIQKIFAMKACCYCYNCLAILCTVVLKVDGRNWVWISRGGLKNAKLWQGFTIYCFWRLNYITEFRTTAVVSDVKLPHLSTLRRYRYSIKRFWCYHYTFWGCLRPTQKIFPKTNNYHEPIIKLYEMRGFGACIH